jgi:cobalt-zinc-cadmium efflux system outer membrane protein
MKVKIFLSVAVITVMVAVLSSKTQAADSWQAPFDATGANSESIDAALSLDDVLALVAAENRNLRSLDYQIQAARGDLDQAGRWSNPELDVEFEEFGWDAPAFDESEFSISVSQEFEFFGQRAARKNVARAGLEATTLGTKLAAFDLYREVKQRFFALVHGQQKVQLGQASVELAQEIVENTQYRLDRGAALQSELLLAQLEEQRALLALGQAKQDLSALQADLALLWRGSPSNLAVACNAEPYPTMLMNELSEIANHADSSRDVLQLQNESEILRAERSLAAAEAKPAITLSGGFKRFEFTGDKSLVFGVSLPIPFLNRNQGTQASLDAQLRSTEYQIDQARSEANASLQSSISQLKQLVGRHSTLDSIVLPAAEGAYNSLRSEYDAGRLPYAQFLEAKRAVNEISFEHNDLLLEIQEQIIAIESITGMVLRSDKEN